jgi:hypothetical protein
MGCSFTPVLELASNVKAIKSVVAVGLLERIKLRLAVEGHAKTIHARSRPANG